MKFPLSERPFAPVRLGADQCAGYERIVQSLLHQTVREYEQFTYLSGGLLNKKCWKAIKHRENLTVYRERAEKDDFAPPSSSPSYEWSLPKLLMTGTTVGTLDDVMYGTLAPTSEAMRIRSTYVQDDILDAQVLYEIQMPTSDHPFQFLGLKWAVRNYASTLSPMAWPRDTVVVEGTGIHMLPNGERLGYRVVHSVDLSQCRELKPLGIVRTRTSSVSLFKQLPNGLVDIYMTRFAESSGSMASSTALAAAATSMTNVWKSVWCSQNKKLSCAAKDGAQKWAEQGRAAQIERLVVTTDQDGQYCCGLCYKNYKLYNSVITCQACNLMVCSRCQVGRKLAKVGYQGEITQYPVLFCKNCITRSLRENALDVAAAECSGSSSTCGEQIPTSTSITPTPIHPVQASSSSSRPATARSGSHGPVQAIPYAPNAPTFNRYGSLDAPSKSTTGRSQLMSVATDSTCSGSLDGLGTYETNNSFITSEYRESEPSSSGLEIQTVDDWERDNDASFYMDHAPRMSPSDTSELASTRGAPNQPLWMQMTQLCMAAEQTYQLTKKNADAMRHHQAYA